jgi:hypothetical protein
LRAKPDKNRLSEKIMKKNNTQNDKKKAKKEFVLSEKDLIHLQEAPIIDNSQFVIKRQIKEKEHLLSNVIISDVERRQYFSTGRGDDKNALLAKKAKEAVKKIETDIAHKRNEDAKTVAEHIKAAHEADEENAGMEDGDIISNLDFGVLLTNTVLKDM